MHKGKFFDMVKIRFEKSKKQTFEISILAKN